MTCLLHVETNFPIQIAACCPFYVVLKRSCGSKGGYAGACLQGVEIFPLSKMTALGKQFANRALDNVTLNAGTNISAGLFRGIEQQKADLKKESETIVSCLLAGGPPPGSTPTSDLPGAASRPPMRAIFLLTDGQPTEGICDSEELAAMTEEMLPDDGTPDQPTAVRVHTFGVGAEHDPPFLCKLAEVGHGHYYAIEEPHQVAQVGIATMIAI